MWAPAWHDEGVDDHALIDAVRRGDRDAFGVVVDRETAAVYRACLRILARPHDAEDVTQEAFVTAYRAIGTFRGDGSLRGWLLRIATRQAYRRLGQRRPTVDLDAVAEPRLADSRDDPTRSVVVAETDYGGPVTAMIAKDNTAGTQFHPEKSQALGLKLIANFLSWRP